MTAIDFVKLLVQVERFSSGVLGLILLSLIGLECIQVLLRFAFSVGLVWSGDIRALLLLALGWLGAAHLWLTRSHLEVNFFSPRYSVPDHYVHFFCDVVAIVGMLWLLPKFIAAMTIYNSMVMPLLPLPLGVKFVLPIIALILIGFCASTRLIVGITNSKEQFRGR